MQRPLCSCDAAFCTGTLCKNSPNNDNVCPLFIVAAPWMLWDVLFNAQVWRTRNIFIIRQIEKSFKNVCFCILCKNKNVLACCTYSHMYCTKCKYAYFNISIHFVIGCHNPYKRLVVVCFCFAFGVPASDKVGVKEGTLPFQTFASAPWNARKTSPVPQSHAPDDPQHVWPRWRLGNFLNEGTPSSILLPWAEGLIPPPLNQVLGQSTFPVE